MTEPRFLQVVTSKSDELNRIQANVAEALRALNTGLIQYFTTTINNSVTNTSPEWDTIVPVSGQTTDGVTWVTIGTVLVPEGSAVSVYSSLEGYDISQLTTGGPPLNISQALHSQYARAVGDALPFLINASFPWSGLTGATISTRHLVSGGAVQLQVRGEAAFSVTFRGVLATLGVYR